MIMLGIWCLKFGILAEGDGHWHGRAIIPRYIRDIDKRKPAVIINPSYFGRFLDLPIDKIDI